MRQEYSYILFIAALAIGIIIFARGLGDNITTIFIYIMYVLIGVGFLRFYLEGKRD